MPRPIAVAPNDAVSMAAAMVRLVRAPAQRRTLQTGAVRTAALLDWSDELNRLDAVYRRAVAGVQDRPFGGATAYVMLSTSGLNASSQVPDLAEHLAAAAALAAR